jgi:hypothetical protein
VNGGETLNPSREETLQIILSLRSTEWNVQVEAIKSFLAIDDLSSIKVIHDYILETKDENVRGYFYKLIKKIFVLDDIDLISHCVFYLSKYHTEDNPAVQLQVEDLIDYFFELDIHLFYKLESVKQIWMEGDLDQRMYFTKKIGEHKLFQLSSLILDNLSYTNEKLVFISITTLKNLGDARASRFLSQLLESDNPKIVSSSIIAIGEIGYFYDYLRIREFLLHELEEIQVAAVWAYSKLIKSFGCKKLHEVYNQTSSNKVKIEILHRLGKIGSKKSTNTLIDILKTERKPILVNRVSWAMHEVENSSKVPVLIERFKKSEPLFQNKLLPIISESFDDRCFDLFVDNIRHSKNDFVVMSSLESITIYHRDECIDDIKKMAFDEKNPFRYFALSSLLNHDNIDHKKIICDIIALKLEDSSLLHQLVMNAIKIKLKDVSHVEEIVDYVFHHLTSNNTNNRYMALEAIVKVPHEKLLRKLHQLTFTDNFKDLVKTSARVFRTITELYPEVVYAYYDYLLDPKLVDELDDIAVEKEFFNNLLDVCSYEEVKYLGPILSQCRQDFVDNILNLLSELELDDIEKLDDVTNILSFQLSTELQFKILDFYQVEKSPERRLVALKIMAQGNNKRIFDYVLHEIDFHKKDKLEILRSVSKSLRREING